MSPGSSNDVTQERLVSKVRKNASASHRLLEARGLELDPRQFWRDIGQRISSPWESLNELGGPQQAPKFHG
jgi:hypothetical protein